MNLEATDHCFVKHANFIEYKKFQISMTSKTAEKRASFEIARYEIMKIVAEMVNGRIINLTLCDILHILDLHSSLISIPNICRLSLAITFGDNKVIASLSDNRTAIYGIRHGSLYYVRTVDELKVFVVKLVQELSTINNWYHRFEHIDVEAICNLYKCWI